MSYTTRTTELHTEFGKHFPASVAISITGFDHDRDPGHCGGGMNWTAAFYSARRL